MKLIQIALFLGVLAGLLMYLRFFRSVLLDRVIALTFFAVQVVIIFFPELTVDLALLLGVGRGTDLVFYFFAVGMMFVVILLYGKIQASEARLTQLVRSLALLTASNPKKADS